MAQEYNKNVKSLSEIEGHVIQINNHLKAICSLLGLKHLEIEHIDHSNWPNLSEEEITEGEKRAIIDAIQRQELERQEFKEKFVEEAKRAAGIIDKTEQFKKMQMSTSGIKPERISVFDKVREAIGESDNGLGKAQAPPKTDWKRIDISKNEKNKILNSIKANPQSKIFSKDFKWDLTEFLSAFKFLESKLYDGPFIVSLVDDKEELQKYAQIEGMEEKVEGIYIGNYVLLSIYDIAATSDEDKYLYMGLKYSPMNGTLKFDTLGTLEGEATKEQKASAKEFLDFHRVVYDYLFVK